MAMDSRKEKIKSVGREMKIHLNRDHDEINWLWPALATQYTPVYTFKFIHIIISSPVQTHVMCTLFTHNLAH